MYHLLAAIIAVVLGVYMSAAGVIYTGSAFSGASAKATAVQIVSSMEQIDAAWTMWESAGGNVKVAGSAAAVQTALTTGGTYLSQFPSPPAIYPGSGGIAYTGGFTVNAYNIDVYTDNVPTLTAGITGGSANETINIGTYFFLDKTIGLNACTAIAQGAGLIAPGTTLTGADVVVTYLGANHTVPLNTSSGIATATDVNALNANFKYWCAPMTAGLAGALVLGGTAAQAGATKDSATYMVYFKHL